LCFNFFFYLFGFSIIFGGVGVGLPSFWGGGGGKEVAAMDLWRRQDVN
jgi:hypothetical protein